MLTAVLRVRSAEAPAHLRTQVFTLGAGLKVTAGSLGAAAFTLVAGYGGPVAAGLVAGVHALGGLLGLAVLGRSRTPADDRADAPLSTVDG
jgi:hypothetical protein